MFVNFLISVCVMSCHFKYVGHNHYICWSSNACGELTQMVSHKTFSSHFRNVNIKQNTFLKLGIKMYCNDHKHVQYTFWHYKSCHRCWVQCVRLQAYKITCAISNPTPSFQDVSSHKVQDKRVTQNGLCFKNLWGRTRAALHNTSLFTVRCSRKNLN